MKFSLFTAEFFLYTCFRNDVESPLTGRCHLVSLREDAEFVALFRRSMKMKLWIIFYNEKKQRAFKKFVSYSYSL